METDILAKIPFFQNFPPDQLQKTLSFMQEQIIDKGEVLIEESSININLYFLMEGKLTVYVGEDEIVEVTRFGEVFGEVSIVSHQLSTATVKASRNSKVAVLNLNDVHEMQDPSIQSLIYRSCAEVLALKLVKTNEIAKTYKNFIDDYNIK